VSKFNIYPLLVGVNIRDRSQLAYQLDPGIKCESPMICWYLTDGSRKVMVDTGGDPPDGVKHMPYKQTEDQLPERALRNIGVDPREIDTVVLTHLHWDHANNNHLFPNAKFYVQKKELQYCVAPVMGHEKIYDLDVIFRTKYEIVDGDARIMEGISVILTPGHTDGSQTVLVDTEGGLYAIVGDLFNLYVCWESAPKIINGLHTSVQTCYDSYAKLEKLKAVPLPGHDFRVFEKKSYP
jgi:glyoxylase-like metal-dependent hydrolase (beta-lactamase superfamily II)